MIYDIIIRNAEIITPTERFAGDIAIKDERIVSVGKIDGGARVEIDANGRITAPGLIDVHVHFDLNVSNTTTVDNFHTGSISAAFGGITTVIDFTDPLPHTPLQECIAKRIEVAQKSFIDYGLHAVIVNWNSSRREEIKEAIEMGVASFKFFTTYSESDRRTDTAALLDAFEEIAKHKGIAMVHAEDDEIVREFTRKIEKTPPENYPQARPSIAEGLAVRTVSYLAEKTGVKLHIAHLSSKEGVKAVTEAMEKHIDISTETTPHYLYLTKDNATLYNSVCPPLREQADKSSLWEAIKSGIISIVSSDHCAFTKQQKDRGKKDLREIPYGLPGVETIWPLLYTIGHTIHKIPTQHLLSLMSLNPAKRFGIYPKKGVIAPGSDADIVILSEGSKEITAGKLHSASGYTPYEGMELFGFPDVVIARGHILVKDGRFEGKRSGKFIRTGGVKR